MIAPRLNPNEVKVLAALASVRSEDFGFIGFRGIRARVKLPRQAIRLACRSLKRKGLARFSAGLWSEDGEPAGSGYAATEAGYDASEAKLREKIELRMWR